MDRVGFIYDNVLLKHEPPPWHPEKKERLIHIVRKLKSSKLWNRLVVIKPRMASYDDISLVHTPGYIEKIRNFTGECLDLDTFVSEGTIEATL